MDPYDFAAEQISSETLKAISDFWDHFAANADGLDRCFSSNMTELSTHPSDVMSALAQVSPNLMWEFGPSERGHKLCVTAEWQDEFRPLARAVRSMAPDLPRWSFIDVRDPNSPGIFKANFKERYRRSLDLGQCTTAIGSMGRIDIEVQGNAEITELTHQILFWASFTLGEEVERDWVGYVEAKPKEKGGLLGMFRKQSVGPFDPAKMLTEFHQAIAAAKAKMPERSYADTPPSERKWRFISLKGHEDARPRGDLITFLSSNDTYAQAALSQSRFSSRNHSKHNEWFFYLRVPRGPAAQFEEIEDRDVLQQKVQDILSVDRLGSPVAAGYGINHVYVDIAATNVAEAVARLRRSLADEPFADDATIHFLDVGLSGFSVPLKASKPLLH